MHCMESRLFRIALTSKWCMTVELWEPSGRCEILFRVIKDWTNSLWSTDSLLWIRLLFNIAAITATIDSRGNLIKAHEWERKNVTKNLLKLFLAMPYNSSSFNWNRNNEFPWRFLNWLLITAATHWRSNRRGWLYERLCWLGCIRIIRVISWLTWEGWSSVGMQKFIFSNIFS